LAGRQHRHVVAFENAKTLPARFVKPFFKLRLSLEPLIDKGSQGVLDDSIPGCAPVSLTEVYEIAV
jgi:hypothetical protein